MLDLDWHLLLVNHLRSSWTIAKNKHARNLQFVLRRSLEARVRRSWLLISRRMNLTEPGVYRAAGRGVGNQHRFEAKDESVVLVVGLDCGFLAPNGKLAEACTPIVCATKRDKRKSIGLRQLHRAVGT